MKICYRNVYILYLNSRGPRSVQINEDLLYLKL